jgi:hypothetical protein
LGRGYREQENKRYQFGISKGCREGENEGQKEKHLLLAGVFSITNLFDPAGFLGPLGEDKAMRRCWEITFLFLIADYTVVCRVILQLIV